MCRRPACLFFLVLFIFLLCKILPDSSWREMLVIKGGRRRILWPRHRRTHRAMFKGSRPSYGISFESTPTVNVNWCNAFGTVAFNGFMSFFFPSSFLSFFLNRSSMSNETCWGLLAFLLRVTWHECNTVRSGERRDGVVSFSVSAPPGRQRERQK